MRHLRIARIEPQPTTASSPSTRRAVKGGESGPPFPQLFLSTFTAYGVNVYLTLGVALKIGSGINVEEMFMGYHAIGALSLPPPCRRPASQRIHILVSRPPLDACCLLAIR